MFTLANRERILKKCSIFKITQRIAPYIFHQTAEIMHKNA
ncbi:hypothetical protein HMPREF2534_02883 [Bacteroides thetaiotaomicron]|nr:hypothetical protein HMPREF2534_02883 [Bacteroides thetaiotaomicron]